MGLTPKRSPTGSGAEPPFVLVVNAGSSTLKLALFDWPPARQPIWRGGIDWEQEHPSDGLDSLVRSLWQKGPLSSPDQIVAVGHRVVHGGETFVQPTLITLAVKQEIHALCPLSPLHNPANLQGIEQMEALLPAASQVAVFDTAFHAHLPEAQLTYPIPYALRQLGIRRYGFHGISYTYCTQRLAELTDRTDLSFICCHLGQGASITAIVQGEGVATTMGMTPMEGVMMGSRSGSIDPGVLIYLLREGRSVDELDDLLNHQSGLKGITETSDMREVLQHRAAGDVKAELAVTMYVDRLAEAIASLRTHLPRFDALVFTAGIGEHAPLIRQLTCDRLRFLGLSLDGELNQQGAPEHNLATVDSETEIYAIPTNEEWVIAQACYRLKSS